MSRRAIAVSAYALAQVLGYLVLALPGAPAYADLEPAVWALMDLGVFVTLAVAADLRGARWTARGYAVAVTVLGATLPGVDESATAARIVLGGLGVVMVLAATTVRRREPEG